MEITMKTGMKKEVVVMNNTKTLFFDQQGGEWVKDSRYDRGGYRDIAEVFPEVFPP